VKKKCWRCGKTPLPPARGEDAAKHRMNFQAALGPERGDMIAYAHCVTRTLMTEQAQALIEGRSPNAPCKCELQAWEAACKRWQRDPEPCWRDLGVTEAALVRAEVWRLRSLRRERPLDPEEKEKLRGLRKKLTPEEDAEIKAAVSGDAALAVKIHGAVDLAKAKGEGRAATLVSPQIKFKCPFCDKEVMAGGPSANVLHELPACEEFLKN
jgi:hypothetical protein